MAMKEWFEGMSIEREIEQWQVNGVPIQRSITNMYYTPRKYGVVEETNIRTDKWDLAQNAMDKVNQDFRQRIKDKINPKADSKALVLSATPSSPLSAAPVQSIQSAVILHPTIVSKKT